MEPLSLRDIHLPDPISWWPPAIGWWLLLALAILIVVGLVWLIRRWRRVTPIKLALRELDALATDSTASPADQLRRLSMLLRRVALSLYPRHEVAGLTGEDWLRWLDHTLSEPRFSQGAGRALIDAPYRPTPPEAIDDLVALTRDWLRTLAKTRAGRRALTPSRS